MFYRLGFHYDNSICYIKDLMFAKSLPNICLYGLFTIYYFANNFLCHTFSFIVGNPLYRKWQNTSLKIPEDIFFNYWGTTACFACDELNHEMNHVSNSEYMFHGVNTSLFDKTTTIWYVNSTQ